MCWLWIILALITGFLSGVMVMCMVQINRGRDKDKRRKSSAQ